MAMHFLYIPNCQNVIIKDLKPLNNCLKVVTHFLVIMDDDQSVATRKKLSDPCNICTTLWAKLGTTEETLEI